MKAEDAIDQNRPAGVEAVRSEAPNVTRVRAPATDPSAALNVDGCRDYVRLNEWPEWFTVNERLQP